MIMSQAEVDDNPSSSNKSLKQARLPFKVLDIKTAFFNVKKKRKLSDRDANKEVEILKTETVTNMENDVNSVNTELRDALSVKKLSDESKKTKEVIIIDIDAEEVNLNIVKSDVKSSSKNPKSDNENDSEHPSVSKTEEGNKSDIHTNDSIATKNEVSKKSDSENGNSIINEVDIANLNTSVESVENMSCDEGSENPNSTLNSSSVSHTESDLPKTETSELDRSQITSDKPCALVGDKTGFTPPVKKKRVSKTPLSAKKLEEMEKRKQEKLRLRAEKEKQLQESRDAKRRAKEVEKDQKEVQRNITKQQKKRELEEKQSKKQAELNEKQKAKDDEKVKKLEATRAKLEEKKRKEEEKQRKKDEEELRKQEEKKKAENEVSAKSKAVFANFFIKNASSQPVPSAEEPCGLFKPFEVTKNMFVASITPVDIISQFDKKNLDESFLTQDTEHLYIEELRSGVRCSYKQTKEKKRADVFDDVMIVEDSRTKGSMHRAKLYQFCENVRPPYYGTWSKTSQTITARKPFTPDTKFFNYDEDSEEEWDEGGPGESLSGTEEEKESEDDYEVDNEFFVPHGYLSADEDQDEEEVATDTAEHQARLKMREREFQEERKQKFSELKPRVVGCVWLSMDIVSYPSHQEELCKVLSFYKAVLLTTVPIQTSAVLQSLTPSMEAKEVKKETPKANKKVPEEAIPHLIRLVHANTRSRQIILREFRQFWTEHRIKEGKVNQETSTNQMEKEVLAFQTPTSSPGTPVKGCPQDSRSTSNSPNTNIFNAGFSKRQLELTLAKIALYGRCPDPNFPRCVWWVHEEIRSKYGCLDLPVPNKWVYVSQNIPDESFNRGTGQRRRKAVLLDSDTPDKVPALDCESSPKAVKADPNNSILKFTCKVSPSERFEANLAIVTSKKQELDSPKSASKDPANSILKFTRKLTTAERFESNLQNPSSDNKMDSSNAVESEVKKIAESKSSKDSPSILKYTRKITPIKVHVPINDKSTAKLPVVNAKLPTNLGKAVSNSKSVSNVPVNDAELPTNTAKALSNSIVIVLDGDDK